jgi:CubicO group peptidase (beta-lactamase class C family)
VNRPRLAGPDGRGETSAQLLELITQRQVPGAVLVTAHDDREPTIAVAGVADQASDLPLAVDSVFPVGSLSKLVTAIVLMQLVDEGRLDLDRPIAEYIPELVLPEAIPLPTLTARHLLTHMSGLDGEPTLPRGQGDIGLDGFVTRCHTLTRLAPPGRIVSYWNAGYVLLGRVAEVLDAMPWPRVLDARVRRPLRLTNTVCAEWDIRARRRSSGHLLDPLDESLVAVPFWTPPPHLAPTGGLWMSAGDLLAVGRLLLDGRAADGCRLLSDAALALMRQPLVEHLEKAVADACGLSLLLISPDHRLVGFAGTLLGQRTFLRLVPDRGYVMVLMTNSLAGGDVEAALREELIVDPYGIRRPARPEPAPQPTPDLWDHVGVFRRSDFEVAVSRGGRGLEVSTRPLVGKGGTSPRWESVPLARVNDAEFVVAVPPPARPASLFFLDRAGRRCGRRARPAYVHIDGRAHLREGTDQ